MNGVKISVDKYLDVEKNKPYYMLSIYNGYASRYQIRITSAQLEGLRKLIGDGTFYDLTGAMPKGTPELKD